MKTISIHFILLLSGIVSFGQITTTKIAPKSKNPTKPYDSLKNFVGKDVNQYLGQELYLKGKPESLREYGYEDFTTDYTQSRIGDKSVIYKCCDGYNSKYIDLAEKYFKVLEIIPHPKAKEDDLLYGKKSFLKLKEKESNDIVYYEYDSDYEHSFPFVVVGYYIILKKRFLNREFITRGKNWISSEPMTELTTGREVTFAPGTKWKCIDITVEEKYFTLSLILENDLGEKIPLSVDNTNNTYWVFTKEEADKYKTKFGAEDWNRILTGKVRIGFTEEMTILSWGEPQKINKSSYGNQWIYDDQYLYFENGKLKSFN
ncbi:MAG TPA: hypothetical protein PK185_16485 [Cyclobacteriaceae bacterium]|nr:hypothetical protein [Cyclobacteriaceae bacterium]